MGRFLANPRILVAIIAFWGISVVSGLGWLFFYSVTPGEGAEAPAHWPTNSVVERALDKPTLLMVVHPRCSCSRASIGEMARLMARLQGEAEARLLFVRPEGMKESWEKTDLWNSALLINDAKLYVDDDGQAALFGAKTSGQVYLYGTDGALKFAGGITPTRSHFGNSVGRERIISLVTSGESDRDRSAVYGCSLQDEDAKDFQFTAVRQPLDGEHTPGEQAAGGFERTTEKKSGGI